MCIESAELVAIIYRFDKQLSQLERRIIVI